MGSELTSLNDMYALNPLDIDTSEIKELSESMPKDGNIDINIAEVMATKYLRGADRCGELVAVATAYLSKCKDAKQKAYNYAFLVKSADYAHIKTDKMRVAFAELDDEYQNACESFNQAIMFSKWVESKYSNFTKMHYMAKKILDMHYDNKPGSFNAPVIESDSGW